MKTMNVVLVSLLLASPAIIFWLWLVIVPISVTKLCPEKCRCDVGGYFVHCSSKGLHNIPSIYLTHVQGLVLNGNNITSLEKDIFFSEGLTELNNLALDSCELQTIEVGAFNGLTKLTSLSMKVNQIKEITRHTFEKLSSLEYLYLQSNKIEHLEIDAFSGLVNLQRIYLDFNKLLKLHPNLFVVLPKLERLNLLGNRDLQIPTDSHFISSHSLKILVMSLCNVPSVSVETFANVSALETLDLGHNNLRSIDINILKALPKLSELYLDLNPLQCDCQLKEVWRWCQDHNIKTRQKMQGCVLEELQCLQDNTSNTEEYEQKHKHLEEFEQISKIILAVKNNVIKPLIIFLIIFGTTCNVIILIIIICNKDMRNVPNMYIFNLAVADMIVLICIIIFTTVSEYSLFGTVFPLFFYRFSVDLSAYSVALLSIQRYRITVNPFHVRISSQPTWRGAVATICGVWVVAAFFAIPSTPFKFPYLEPSFVPYYIAYYKRVVAYELLVSCVFPLFVIAFSYIMTARYLVKSSFANYEETQNPQLYTRKNAAKIVLGLTVVFLISYGPMHIAWAYFIFKIDVKFNQQNDPVVWHEEFYIFYIILLAIVLLLVNSCLNPVAIFCTSSQFRKHLKRCLCCCCKTNSTSTDIELARRN
jgi:hypothetical protein